MDITSTFKKEIFRPLITLVIPGFTAVCPYLFVAADHFSGLKIFWSKNPYPFTGILFIIIIAVGLILEDIGSRIECCWDRSICGTENDDNWKNYLKLELKDEIIGQRYLRTILTRMKFELSMGPALLIFAGGFLWLNSKVEIIECYSCFVIFILSVFLGVYILYESYAGAKLLRETRQTIIEGAEARKKR